METNSLLDERSLVMQVSEGDHHAFTTIFNHYYPLLFSYIRRILRSEEDTENILQDVFAKIWMGREALAHVERFRPYLWIMARHQALNALRTLANREKVQHAFENSLSVAAGTEETREKEWQLTLVDEAIQQLPELHRRVWLMNRKDKIRQAEIAEQLNISLPTVKKYMQQAIEQVSVYVKDKSSLGAAILTILSLFSEKN